MDAAKLRIAVEVDVDEGARDLRSLQGNLDETAKSARQVDPAVTSLENSMRRMGASSAENGRQAATALRQVATESGQTAAAIDRIPRAGGGNPFAGIVRGALDLGSKLGFTIMGLQQLGQTALSLGSAFFSGNAAMEQTTVSLTTMLGSLDAAKSMMSDLTQFAAETPFEMPQLAQSTRLLLAYRFEAEQVIPILRNIGDAAASLGGGAVEIDRITRALGQMQAKGKVMAGEMLQLAELGINGYAILAEAMGLSVAQVMALGEQGKLVASEAIPMLLAGMDKAFGGGMQAQAKTFNGIVSTIKDNLSLAFQRVTMPFFDQAKEGLQRIVEYTKSAGFDETMESWAGKAADLAGGIKSFVIEDGPMLLGLAQDVATNVGLIADAGFRVLSIWSQIKALGDGKSQAESDLPDTVTGPDGVEVEVKLVEKKGYGLWDLVKDVDSINPISLSNTVKAVQGLDQSLRAVNEFGYDHANVMAYATAMETATNELIHQSNSIPPLSARMQEMTGAQIVAEFHLRKQTEAAAEYAAGLYALNAGQEEAATAAARSSAVQAANAERIRQLNMDTLDYVDTLSTVQQIAYSAGEAFAMLANQQHRLAGAYQAGLATQQMFTQQSSEYQSQIGSVEKAVEILQKRQEAGLPLAANELQLLEQRDEIIGRLNGGVEDATVQAGLAAAANGLLMKAQDELNRAFNDGEIDLVTYNQKLAEAQSMYGDPAATSPLQIGLQAISTVIQTDLIGAIDNLTRKVEYIAKPWLVQIDAAASDAEAELNRITDMLDRINQGAYGMVAVDIMTTQQMVPTGARSLGGLVTAPEVSLIGEDGPELILPLSKPQRMRELLPLVMGQGSPEAKSQSSSSGAPGASSYMPFLTSLMGDLAAASGAMGEGLDGAKSFTDGARDAVSLIGEALGLLDALGTASVTYGPDIAARIATLALLSGDVTRAIVDSAASMEKEGLEHSQIYADASRSALGTLEAALAFNAALGDSVVVYGEHQRQNVANLKFLTEHATASIGDSAQLMDGPYLEHTGVYATAAQAALATVERALSFVEAMGDRIVTNDQQTRDNISALKFMTEHATASIGDSAQMMDGSYLAHTEVYAGAAQAALAVVTDALALHQALADVSVQSASANAEAVSNLKFLAEHATASVGDSAQIFEGPYLANLETYASAVDAALSTLTGTLDLHERIRDVTESKRGLSMAIAADFDTLAELSRLAAEAAQRQAATWDGELNPALAAYDEAVGSSVSILGGTLGLVSSLNGSSRRQRDLSRDFATIFAGLADISRLAATEARRAAAGWDGEVNEGLKEYEEAAGASLGILRDVASTIEALTKLPDRIPSVSNLATRMVHIVEQVTAAVGESNMRWRELVASGTAPPMAELAEWAQGAGQAVEVVSGVAASYEAIAGTSRLTQRHAQTFRDNFAIVLELVSELDQLGLGYLDDAHSLQDTAVAIAEAIRAAADAIQVVAGGGAGGYSGSGAGGGGGGPSASAILGGGGAGSGGSFSGSGGGPASDSGVTTVHLHMTSDQEETVVSWVAPRVGKQLVKGMRQPVVRGAR